jgi:hypothetical protein
MLLKARSEDAVGVNEESRDRERQGSQGALVCARCRSLVTSRAAAIPMRGSHAHTFANPHGFEFRIGCFADAPGCVEVGAESTYWTWFEGFTWRVSVCRHCGEHLGWLFRSPDARFFGLILDHLTQAD